MIDDDDDLTEDFDAPARNIPSVMRMLEGKWKSEARPLGAGFSGLWAMVRGAKTGVAFVELIQTDQTWGQIAREGVTVREAAWGAARSLCTISGLPLLVVVDAADDVRFYKVTEFGPAHLRTQRLSVPNFRPA